MSAASDPDARKHRTPDRAARIDMAEKVKSCNTRTSDNAMGVPSMIKVVDLAAPTPALHRDVTVGSNCDGGEGMEVSAAALVRLARATTIAPVRGSEGSGREHRATFSDRSRRRLDRWRRDRQKLSRRGVSVGAASRAGRLSPPASDVHRAFSRDVDAARDAATACRTPALVSRYSDRSTAGMVMIR